MVSRRETLQPRSITPWESLVSPSGKMNLIAPITSTTAIRSPHSFDSLLKLTNPIYGFPDTAFRMNRSDFGSGVARTSFVVEPTFEREAMR